MAAAQFDYETGFSRNIGWFTEEEQTKLGSKKVVIAGCGGAGGNHANTMARLGIGKFHLADFDTFGIENFNRQAGAAMSTIGKPKLGVTEAAVLDINPEAEINTFPDGVTDDNLDAFLEGADLYLDSLDFFAMHARRNIFEACAKRNIPAVTAAPLGMGTAFLCFMPGEMTFEEYFGLDGKSEEEQYLRFYLGLSPSGLHNQYLVDPTKLSVTEKRGPSTIIGCTMGAGVAAAYVVKILLGRGDVVSAPEGAQWDPYLNRLEKTNLEGGHLSPVFQTQLAAAKQVFGLS